MRYIIDEMRPADWDQVRAIYQMGIDTGNATFEIEAPNWKKWDLDHLSIIRLIARMGEPILGWAALSPVSRRPVYAGVAEVSVYVHQDYRGQGLGGHLLKTVIDASEANRIWTLQSSTFPENEASIALQISCGFRVVGRRERIARHRGVWRDTILMERRSALV